MIGTRSIALAVATLGSAVFGLGSGAQACGDWGTWGNSRASFVGGPTVYGYYSGDRDRRSYRSSYRSNLGGPVIRISTGRNYGNRSGWRQRHNR
jgi:hypothetical protein